MATITQTIEEFKPITLLKQVMSFKPKPNLPPKTSLDLPPQTLGCPEDCPCKQEVARKKSMQLLFNALGILIALLATYLIVTTETSYYLFFWVGYSILRRMSRSKAPHPKSD